MTGYAYKACAVSKLKILEYIISGGEDKILHLCYSVFNGVNVFACYLGYYKGDSFNYEGYGRSSLVVGVIKHNCYYVTFFVYFRKRLSCNAVYIVINAGYGLAVIACACADEGCKIVRCASFISLGYGVINNSAAKADGSFCLLDHNLNGDRSCLIVVVIEGDSYFVTVFVCVRKIEICFSVIENACLDLVSVYVFEVCADDVFDSIAFRATVYLSNCCAACNAFDRYVLLKNVYGYSFCNLIVGFGFCVPYAVVRIVKNDGNCVGAMVLDCLVIGYGVGEGCRIACNDTCYTCADKGMKLFIGIVCCSVVLELLVKCCNSCGCGSYSYGYFYRSCCIVVVGFCKGVGYLVGANVFKCSGCTALCNGRNESSFVMRRSNTGNYVYVGIIYVRIAVVCSVDRSGGLLNCNHDSFGFGYIVGICSVEGVYDRVSTCVLDVAAVVFNGVTNYGNVLNVNGYCAFYCASGYVGLKAYAVKKCGRILSCVSQIFEVITTDNSYAVNGNGCLIDYKILGCTYESVVVVTLTVCSFVKRLIVICVNYCADFISTIVFGSIADSDPLFCGKVIVSPIDPCICSLDAELDIRSTLVRHCCGHRDGFTEVVSPLVTFDSKALIIFPLIYYVGNIVVNLDLCSINIVNRVGCLAPLVSFGIVKSEFYVVCLRISVMVFAACVCSYGVGAFNLRIGINPIACVNDVVYSRLGYELLVNEYSAFSVIVCVVHIIRGERCLIGVCCNLFEDGVCVNRCVGGYTYDNEGP